MGHAGAQPGRVNVGESMETRLGRVDVLIAGAGILGSGVAWALAQRGVTDVCVLDLDLDHMRAPLLHARPVRTSWDRAENVAASRATLRFYAEEPALRYSAAGHLWLYERAEAFERARIRADRREVFEVASLPLTGEEITKRFPFLDRVRDGVAGGLLLPEDGCIDPCAVRRWFREQARAAGVRFVDGVYVDGLITTQREPGARRLERVDVLQLEPGRGSVQSSEIVRWLTSHAASEPMRAPRGSVRPGIVINALGPWSSVFTAKLGQPTCASPCRQQLAVLSVNERAAGGRVLEGVDLVVDDAGAFCFADSAYTVAGPTGRGPIYGFDLSYAGQSYFENAIWPHLASRSSLFERVHHLRGLCTLDSRAPDGSGVLGWLAGYSNVLEIHSFPASGLMHAFAVCRGLAELIVDGRYEALDLRPFAGDRFRTGESDRWADAGLLESTRL